MRRDARRTGGRLDDGSPGGGAGDVSGPRRTARHVSRARGLVGVLAVLLAVGGCTPLDDAMVAVFGRSMRSSVSFDPYENPHQPAENAVPFASSNYPSAPGVVNLGEPEGLDEDVPPLTGADVLPPPGSDRVNALENPVPADSASLARGQVVYERMCSVCHGVDGYSQQSVMVQEIAGMGVMAAYNLADGAAVDFTDGYLYGVIRVGRGLMPSYGHRITHFDRWHVVNWVRELQGRAAQLVPPTGGGGAAPDTAGAGGAPDGGEGS